MKCDYCPNQSISEKQKEGYIQDGWLGVLFYNSICTECFEKEKVNI